MQEKECFFGIGVDVNIVCEYSESGLVPRSAALAGIETSHTELDVHAGVLGTIDRRTRDDILWIPARVKRQVRSQRI